MIDPLERPDGKPGGDNPWQDVARMDRLEWGPDEDGGNEYDSWMQLMWSGVVTRLSTMWDYLSDVFLPRDTQQDYMRHGQGLAHKQFTSRAGNRGIMRKLITEQIAVIDAALEESLDADETKRLEAWRESLIVAAHDLRQKQLRAMRLGVYWDSEQLLEELAKKNPSAAAVEAAAPPIWQRMYAYGQLTKQGTGQLHREAMLARTLHTNPDVGVGTQLERSRRRRREGGEE